MKGDPGLLPCPFCGGPATFFEEESASRATQSSSWSVGCANNEVDCIAYQMMATFSRKADAAAAWNTRSRKDDERACNAAPIS